MVEVAVAVLTLLVMVMVLPILLVLVVGVGRGTITPVVPGNVGAPLSLAGEVTGSQTQPSGSSFPGWHPSSKPGPYCGSALALPLISRVFDTFWWKGNQPENPLIIILFLLLAPMSAHENRPHQHPDARVRFKLRIVGSEVLQPEHDMHRDTFTMLVLDDSVVEWPTLVLAFPRSKGHICPLAVAECVDRLQSLTSCCTPLVPILLAQIIGEAVVHATPSHASTILFFQFKLFAHAVRPQWIAQGRTYNGEKPC